MQLNVLKCKIHKARITKADLHYEGSLAIDQDLMDKIGLKPFERILVVNITNGERLETYAIQGERGTGEFLLNGSAARRGEVGDVITIMCFANVSEEEYIEHSPKVIVLNEENEIINQKGF